MAFHIIIYIILPVSFFAISSSTSRTTKLFVIAWQATIFFIFQIIVIVIDIPFQIWKNKKTSCLSDQRVGFKYYQR